MSIGTYTDILLTDITQDILDDCSGTKDVSTIRKSIDGFRGILEFNGSTPSWVTSLGLTPRNHSDALAFYSSDLNWIVE